MTRSVSIIATLLLSLQFVAQEPAKAPNDPQAQDPAQVPSLVMESFTREHPGDKGTWSRTGDDYRVEFIDRESRLGHAIVYDRNGNVLKRDSELGSVPGPINDYYQKNYPGETFRTWSSEPGEGEKYYYSNRKKEELRFDKDGKLLSPKSATPSPEKKTGKTAR